LDQRNILRIGGNDRYEISFEVAKYFNFSGKGVGIATGQGSPDALTGSVYTAKHNINRLRYN
jgi:putative cell wall-binding protein